jgi:hypothetical protein
MSDASSSRAIQSERPPRPTWRERLNSGWFVALVYALVSLAVAGPLLRPGLVLSIDLAQTPRSGLSPSYWGLPAGTNGGSLARLPFDALLRLAGMIGAIPVVQKLLLLSIVFLAGLGMHRLAGRRLPGRFFAGMLYAVNPFVLERLIAGQWFLLLSYALIPWGFAAFLATFRGDLRAAWRFALIAAIAGFADAHMAALLGLLSIVTLIANVGRDRLRQLGPPVLALALAACASLLWLIPAPDLQELWSHVGHAQLQLYSTFADPHWGSVLTVLGLGGFWDDPSPGFTALAAWPLFAMLLFGLAIWGTALASNRRVAIAVGACGLFGLIAALGTASSVTRPATLWLMDHFPFLRSFRETDKTVALAAFAYAFLGANAVDDLVSAPRRRQLVPVLTTLAIALPLVYGMREFGGAWGSLHAVEFPVSWTQAAALLRSRVPNSRTLFLPFHGYLHLGFARSPVVYNPAQSFFPTPILAGRSVDQSPGHQDVSDPEQNEVAALLADPSRPDLGRCLAALGVSDVLLAHEADWTSLRRLERRTDMRVVRHWPDLTLLTLRRPGSPVMTVPATATGPCPRGLVPLAFRRLSPVRLELLAPVPAGRRLVLGVPDAFSWHREGDKVAFSPWPDYRRVYIWALGGLALVVVTGLLMLVRERRRPRRSRSTPRNGAGVGEQAPVSVSADRRPR